MHLATLSQNVVDALTLETVVTALRLKIVLLDAGPSRAATLNALAALFVEQAPHGMTVNETMGQALTFLANDRVVFDQTVVEAAEAHCAAGTNPPNAADVLAEEI